MQLRENGSDISYFLLYSTYDTDHHARTHTSDGIVLYIFCTYRIYIHLYLPYLLNDYIYSVHSTSHIVALPVQLLLKVFIGLFGFIMYKGNA